MKIGDRIRARRVSLGWSQRELAEKMGYKNHSVVARVESGQVDLPQSRLVQFSDVLGVTPGHLMGWTEEPEDLGALAGRVLRDPALLKIVQSCVKLDEDDLATVATLVASLAEKKKS